MEFKYNLKIMPQELPGEFYEDLIQGVIDNLIIDVTWGEIEIRPGDEFEYLNTKLSDDYITRKIKISDIIREAIKSVLGNIQQDEADPMGINQVDLDFHLNYVKQLQQDIKLSLSLLNDLCKRLGGQ